MIPLILFLTFVLTILLIAFLPNIIARNLPTDAQLDIDRKIDWMLSMLENMTDEERREYCESVAATVKETGVSAEQAASGMMAFTAALREVDKYA